MAQVLVGGEKRELALQCREFGLISILRDFADLMSKLLARCETRALGLE